MRTTSAPVRRAPSRATSARATSASSSTSKRAMAPAAKAPSTKKPAQKPAKKAASKPAKKAASKPAKKAASKPAKKAAPKTAKKAATKKATKKTASTRAPAPAPTTFEPRSHDPIAARVEALTSAFTALGAREPERWARAHVEHGLDQIGRFVFLRALWGRVVKDGRFLDRLRREQGETKRAVERLLMAGAHEGDLVDLVRAMQVHLLVDLAQILDDPSDNDEGVRWGLWRMDKRGLPLWQLGDLRLDILEVDPADDM